jgi:hypothetical protein
MKKLNSVIYNKLLAQAEEAKSQGLTKLASGILEAIGPYPNDESSQYSYSELQDDINRDMWKMATRLMHYYDVESVDAEKLNEAMVVWASKMLEELEVAMNVDSVVVGPLEPKVPGEDK